MIINSVCKVFLKYDKKIMDLVILRNVINEQIMNKIRKNTHKYCFYYC